MREKKVNQKVMRNLLEVRFKRRLFSFINFNGQFIDHLVKTTGFQNIHIPSANRIEIANDSFTKIYFFTWENFGFQLEGNTKIEQFGKEVNHLFNSFKDFSLYDISEIKRIGTKSSILNYTKDDTFQELQKIFRKKLFTSFETFEKKSGSKLIELGYFLNDYSSDDGKFNMLTGPVTKEEALMKFFHNNEIYKAFSEECGIYMDIDYFQDKEETINSEDIKTRILQNIVGIEKKVEAFLEYFYE